MTTVITAMTLRPSAPAVDLDRSRQQSFGDNDLVSTAQPTQCCGFGDTISAPVDIRLAVYTNIAIRIQRSLGFVSRFRPGSFVEKGKQLPPLRFILQVESSVAFGIFGVSSLSEQSMVPLCLFDARAALLRRLLQHVFVIDQMAGYSDGGLDTSVLSSA